MADCDKAKPIVPLQTLVTRKTVMSSNPDVLSSSTDGCTIVGVRKGKDIFVMGMLSALAAARVSSNVMILWLKACVGTSLLVGWGDR